VPLVAEEPLIQAAVFGLFWPSTLVEAARQITVPIEFDLQWDDEHIPREGGLALFDAFGSTEKSLHVNGREAHGAATLRGSVSGPVSRAAPAGLTSGEAVADLLPTRTCLLRLAGGDLCDLDEIAACVIEDGRGDRTHRHWRLNEPNA
jgi:hypothetical protein